MPKVLPFKNKLWYIENEIISQRRWVSNIVMSNFSRKTWEDVYYEDLIDEQYEVFDEDSQEIINYPIDDGWDKIKE